MKRDALDGFARELQAAKPVHQDGFVVGAQRKANHCAGASRAFLILILLFFERRKQPREATT